MREIASRYWVKSFSKEDLYSIISEISMDPDHGRGFLRDSSTQKELLKNLISRISVLVVEGDSRLFPVVLDCGHVVHTTNQKLVIF